MAWGIRCVPIRPLVVAPQIAKVSQSRQPSRRACRAQQPESQAALMAEPAIHHGRTEHEGSTPRPHTDHHTPEEIEVEQGSDLRRGGDTAGNEEETEQHDAPWADAQ